MYIFVPFSLLHAPCSDNSKKERKEEEDVYAINTTGWNARRAPKPPWLHAPTRENSPKGKFWEMANNIVYEKMRSWLTPYFYGFSFPFFSVSLALVTTARLMITRYLDALYWRLSRMKNKFPYAERGMLQQCLVGIVWRSVTTRTNVPMQGKVDRRLIMHSSLQRLFWMWPTSWRPQNHILHTVTSL